jgi:hypothetical protein
VGEKIRRRRLFRRAGLPTAWVLSFLVVVANLLRDQIPFKNSGGLDTCASNRVRQGARDT